MRVNRRLFLQATAATVLPLPAISMGREPYVKTGESVSFVGAAKCPDPCFIGSALVCYVGAWNGEGYPCILKDQSFRPLNTMSAVFLDQDLCNYNRELGDFCGDWPDPVARGFKNLAELVRTGRA